MKKLILILLLVSCNPTVEIKGKEYRYTDIREFYISCHKKIEEKEVVCYGTVDFTDPQEFRATLHFEEKSFDVLYSKMKEFIGFVE